MMIISFDSDSQLYFTPNMDGKATVTPKEDEKQQQQQHPKVKKDTQPRSDDGLSSSFATIYFKDPNKAPRTVRLAVAATRHNNDEEGQVAIGDEESNHESMTHEQLLDMGKRGDVARIRVNNDPDAPEEDDPYADHSD